MRRKVAREGRLRKGRGNNAKGIARKKKNITGRKVKDTEGRKSGGRTGKRSEGEREGWCVVIQKQEWGDGVM